MQRLIIRNCLLILWALAVAGCGGGDEGSIPDLAASNAEPALYDDRTIFREILSAEIPSGARGKATVRIDFTLADLYGAPLKIPLLGDL